MLMMDVDGGVEIRAETSGHRGQPFRQGTSQSARAATVGVIDVRASWRRSSASDLNRCGGSSWGLNVVLVKTDEPVLAALGRIPNSRSRNCRSIDSSCRVNLSSELMR